MEEVMVRKMMLDVLKPLEPSILELSKNIASLEGVDSVSIDLLEIDKKVENVKILITGHSLDYNEINTVIEGTGATIHSIDNVHTVNGSFPSDEPE